jgi:RHS repeat-associated protein
MLAAKEQPVVLRLAALFETRVRPSALPGTACIGVPPFLSSTSQQACWQVYDRTAVGRLVGLDYFGARYYSGAQGRFTSPDAPLLDQHPEDPQSWNLYSYVRNNPLRFIDPTGQTCQTSGGLTYDDMDGQGCAAVDADNARGVRNDASRTNPAVQGNTATHSLLLGALTEGIQRAEVPVNAAAVATGAVLSLPVVVPAAASAAGSAVGFGYGLSTLGGSGIVLGRYPDYINAARSMGASAFNLPQWLYRGLDAIGEGWTANRVFIDTAVRLGKQINLSNGPVGQGGSIFAQELQYLQTRWGIAPSTLPRTLPVRSGR